MKKILVVGPALPEWSDMRAIAKSLHFLSEHYELDFIDPLRDLNHHTDKLSFFSEWQRKIESLLSKYDAFFGFSLGGVVLQQCFDQLEKPNKPIVLFSVPSFSDKLISERLGKVISLIKEKKITPAISLLNQFVFYPYDLPSEDLALADPESAALRLSSGLQFVLETDSRLILQRTKLNYLHLLGAESQLVNSNNVIVSPSSQLVIVPQAGMRVLQDNLMHCTDSIVKFLKGRLS